MKMWKFTNKGKKDARKLDVDRVSLAIKRSHIPGFNEKFTHPRSLRRKTV